METLVFDKNRKRIKYCPCCGHDNKKQGYVPYVGTDAGYCNYCGSSCFPDKGTLISPQEYERIAQQRKLKEKPSFIVHSLYENSLKNYDNNSFTKFLLGQFGKTKTKEIINQYKLGTKENKVIFWQIDIDKKIRSGKIMDYDPATGKRSKYINWVHSNIDNYNLQQCLFGEHLLIGNNKKIALVESEKTACIMSQCNQAYLWLATGGSSSGIEKKLKALHGNKNQVVFFPDQGKYKEWKKLMEVYLKYNCTTSRDCEIWHEKGLIKKGDDIADYYLNEYGFDKQLMKPQKIDPEWNDWLDRNPDLKEKWSLNYI
jgi:hypothetical protein